MKVAVFAVPMTKAIIFALPLTLFVLCLAVKICWPDFYELAIQEDSAIEYAQAIFYFVASMFAAALSFRFKKVDLRLLSGLYALLAAGLLFVASEEISWGQRIFDMNNPVYFDANNVQNEISFHNLKSFQSKLHDYFILVGAYGAFSWLLAARFVPKLRPGFQEVVKFVVPEWYLSSYFFLVFLVYVAIEYVARPHEGSFLIWRDQEPVELLLSLGFLVFTLLSHVKFGALAGSMPFRVELDLSTHAA